jgi:lipoprotein
MIKKIKRSDYEGVRTSLQELARSNNWHLSFVSCFDNGIQGQARTGYDAPYEVVVTAPNAKQYGLLHQADVCRSPVCKTTLVEQSLKSFIDENVCAAVKEELNGGIKG